MISLTKLRYGDVMKNLDLAKCEFKNFENSARLLSNDKHHSKRIKNEATLRYVPGGPIMEIMCDSGNLKVC